MSKEPRSEWWAQRAFVYVGRIEAAKGIQHILRAWLELAEKEPDVPPLWIVGGRPEEVDTARHAFGAHRLEPFERARLLHWWGYLDPAGVSAVLLRGLVLIMHSQYEPGGRVVLEAMTEGLPVIATPSGFARNLVSDWATGFIVSYGDVTALRQRMEHFLRQPYLCQALGAQARRVALENLNSWGFIDAHCTIYDEVVAGVIADPALPPAIQIPTADAFFDRRHLPPTYPIRDRQPSDADVRSWIGSWAPILDITLSRHDRGSSLIWRASVEEQQWFVKYSYSRLELRPIWDAFRPLPLLRTAAERYNIETQTSRLPGFIPFEAFDDRRLLLGRLVRDQPSMEDQDLPVLLNALAEPLNALHGSDIALLIGRSVLPDLGLRPTTVGDARTALELLNAVASASEVAWVVAHHVDIALSWRLVQFESDAGRLRLPADWTPEDAAALVTMITTALSLPTVRWHICHGSPHLKHFLHEGGGWLLIDGEQVHPGDPAEDWSRLALDLAKRLRKRGTAAPLRQTIMAVADAELTDLSRLIVWCGLLTLEGIVRNETVIRPSSAVTYRAFWNELKTMIESTGG